jgi:hypothetical protein
MSTARVLLKQGSTTYRFLRFETSPDGSLIIIDDRDSKRRTSLFESSQDGLVPVQIEQPDRVLPGHRFSIHTTGIVHYRDPLGKRKSAQIEPLHSLTKLALVGVLSIPRISSLNLFDESRHQSDAPATLEFPEDVSERITFALEIGPTPQTPATFGIALNYEIYSIVVRVVPFTWDENLAGHFIGGIAIQKNLQIKGVNKATAELEFHQRIHGRQLLVFREDKGGAYVTMAVVPMVKTPNLIVTFDRQDLRIEVIPFELEKAPTHKVRFWICDKGGRNKVEDLRRHITSVSLDADLLGA